MKKCPKCEAQYPDSAKTCTICGRTLPVKIVSLEDMLRARAQAAEKAAGQNTQEQAPAPNTGQNQKTPEEKERTQLEKQLAHEWEKRGRAEEALENYKHLASEQDSTTKRLQIDLDRYKKFLNKPTLGAALGIVIAGIILIIVGFAGKGSLKKELAEIRPYKNMYDSLRAQSRKTTSERDSLRRELANLQHKYAALLEQDSLATHAKSARTGRGAAQASKANIKIEMVHVQGGTFIMGCTAEQGKDCNDDEKPARSITVGSFSIGKYPITQGQWKQVMGSEPAHYKGDNLPVERVSWRDAQNFVKKLNEVTGEKYRLPTEAEWEYAARGGNRSRGYKFAGSNHIEEVAWYARTNGTTKTGTRKPNELNIYDMSGNVSEWVSDRYGKYGDPILVADDYRVLRGGSWSSVAKSCRVASRANMPPGTRGNNIGFRVAK